MAINPIIVGQHVLEVENSLMVGKGLYIPVLTDTITPGTPDPPKYPLLPALGYYDDKIWRWDITAAAWGLIGGTGDNFANADLTFTDNRTHDGNGKALSIINVANVQFIVLSEFAINADSFALTTVGQSSISAQTVTVVGVEAATINTQPGGITTVGGVLSDLKLNYGGGGVIDTAGEGSPEGSLIALPGSLYRQRDGTPGTLLWIKQTGTDEFGWNPIA